MNEAELSRQSERTMATSLTGSKPVYIGTRARTISLCWTRGLSFKIVEPRSRPAVILGRCIGASDEVFIPIEHSQKTVRSVMVKLWVVVSGLAVVGVDSAFASNQAATTFAQELPRGNKPNVKKSNPIRHVAGRQYQTMGFSKMSHGTGTMSGGGL